MYIRVHAAVLCLPCWLLKDTNSVVLRKEEEAERLEEKMKKMETAMKELELR